LSDECQKNQRSVKKRNPMEVTPNRKRALKDLNLELKMWHSTSAFTEKIRTVSYDEMLMSGAAWVREARQAMIMARIMNATHLCLCDDANSGPDFAMRFRQGEELKFQAREVVRLGRKRGVENKMRKLASGDGNRYAAYIVVPPAVAIAQLRKAVLDKLEHPYSRKISLAIYMNIDMDDDAGREFERKMICVNRHAKLTPV